MVLPRLAPSPTVVRADQACLDRNYTPSLLQPQEHKKPFDPPSEMRYYAGDVEFA